MHQKTSNMLIAIAIKNNGNWDKIRNDITKRRWPTDEEIEAAASVQAITLVDPEYPIELKETYKPPFVLFFKGDITLLEKDYSKRLGVVGSRALSVYKEEDIKNILTSLVTKFDIVSGLALGTDTIAHQTTVENGGKTIVVLGGGLNKCYPPSNKPLLDSILATGGLVLSQYPSDCEPSPDKFPQRDRIIAGLCKKLLVVEVKERSGTCITVSFALQNGREIYVLPITLSQSNVNTELYNNKLIAKGANIYTGPEDLEN